MVPEAGVEPARLLHRLILSKKHRIFGNGLMVPKGALLSHFFMFAKNRKFVFLLLFGVKKSSKSRQITPLDLDNWRNEKRRFLSFLTTF